MLNKQSKEKLYEYKLAEHFLFYDITCDGRRFSYLHLVNAVIF